MVSERKRPAGGRREVGRRDERTGSMATKRQQTQAKMAREREVKERRARKLEKKHAAATERKARTEGTIPASDEM
jgi:hypothetical protein